MLKGLINYLVVFTLITTKGFGAEEGGMPQLNPEYWISQIFWLIIVFSCLYIFLSQIILPKISQNLELRKSKVLENLEQAEKNKEDSEKKVQEYEKILNEAKSKAKKIMDEAKKKINKDINVKKNELDSEIEKEINLAEEEIKILKKNSVTNINKISIEISSDIVKKMINVELNKSNVSAIVEDISKKRIEKYIW